MPAFGIRTLIAACGLLTAVAQAQPPAPPAAPQSMPLPVPAELPRVPQGDGPPMSPGTQLLIDPPGLPPLPGSAADEYTEELRDRERFRTTTWRGSVIKGLPNSLLWEPALAVRRDPRLQFSALNRTNYEGGNLDTSIGGTAGLIRADVNGADLSYQLDMFGVVQTRLGANDLQAADYRFGVPVTWRRGWWQGKLAYEHTSAHLGDKFILRTGRPIAFYAKDEVVLGLGRILYNQLRVYGHLAYAFNNQLPDFNGPTPNGRFPNLESSTKSASRADIGFEWFDRCSTGFAGTPFVAANLEIRGDQSTPNFRGQVGYMFRNPTQRMGNARFFLEYYNGHTPYGQFYLDKESNFSAGFGFDY